VIDCGSESAPKKENSEFRLQLFGSELVITQEGELSLSIFDDVTIEHIKEESCTIEAFGTEVTINEDGITLKSEGAVTIDGSEIKLNC
jgi:hypothetical protein